ncbi:MAG TPA: sulfite exporter TauE/SafE family protein [Chlamydiales bacterium]|nr:sulfite exporter TauE/SafE family protein [Chlamydiales bacterium]
MPADSVIILFIILGLISGLLGGLLGLGGGVVTVPVLYFIFLYTGTFEEKIMQVAVSTSLAAGVVNSGLSTYFQHQKKAILFNVFRLLIPGLVIGCVGGSVLAHYLPSQMLSKIFGVMAVVLGTYFFFPRLPNLKLSNAPNRTLSLFGLGIGVLSSLLGIGGGSLTFPVLLGYQVPVQNSSATSSVSTLMTTLIGSVTYLVIAWHMPELPATFGYIEIPAFIAISLGSLLTVGLGVKLSHAMKVAPIKRLFGCCLALIGLSMLFI